MLRIKQGVRLKDVSPELLVGIMVAMGVFAIFGEDCWLTSVVDSHDSGLHPKGRACDLRTTAEEDLDASEIVAIHAFLKKELDLDFDILLESNHIHMEFDPK